MNKLSHPQSFVGQDEAIVLMASRMRGLSDSDMMALSTLRALHRFVGRGRQLIKEGTRVTCLRVLCKGWGIRSLQLDDERRQILDFVLPGDLVGLHVDGTSVSTCDVTALTPCDVGEINLTSLEAVADTAPGVAKGLHQIAAREMALANGQIMRLGRMTAYERVCSFLLDIYERQRPSFPGSQTVDFPITQTIVSDALGLSVVHVNRQVMQLRREGLVTLNRKQLTVHDPVRLAEISARRNWMFDPSEQAARHAAE